MWVGNAIYYISDKTQQTINLYRYNLDSGRADQLTHYSDADIHWPSTDGKTIVFERDGYLSSYDIADGKVSPISPSVRGDLIATRPQLRRLTPAISSLALSPSGARILVEARGHIFSVPAKHGQTRDYTINDSGSRARYPDWSPDGKTIAFMSDRSGEYQIYTMPQRGGDATQVSDYKGPSIENMAWAPDSKHIIFTTAALDLDVLDVASKKVTTVYTDAYGAIPSYDFSSDSRWLAFIGTGKNLFGSLHLYNMDTGKTTQVTSGFYNDSQVAFDQTGKYLYLVSDRTYTPANAPFEEHLFLGPTSRVYVMTLQKVLKNPLEAEDDEEHPSAGAGSGPRRRQGGGGGAAGGQAPAGGGSDGSAEVKIDLDGLANRVLPLPLPARSYGAIIGSSDGLFIFSEGDLVRFDLHSRAATPLMLGIAGILTFNADRSKFAYDQGGVVGIADIHPGPPVSVGEGRVDTGSVEAVIDPRAEWRQMFWEAWRYERDHFYDKNFLGLNWDAIGKHYASYLPYIAHRADLNYVLGLMIGEFGTSHAYVLGGDTGVNLPQIPTGELGADYDVVNGKVRIKKIYKGEDFSEARRAPLSDPGVDVNEGDYLLAVDGQPVDEWHSPDSLMIDKPGKDVVLTVNATATPDGARHVSVRPVATEDTLRYATWVAAARKYVDEKSGGRIGYIHVPDTSAPGMSSFLEGFYSQSDKDAVIVDERWNAGGNIPTFFTEWLGRSYHAFLKARRGADVRIPNSDSSPAEGHADQRILGLGRRPLPMALPPGKSGSVDR